MNFDDILIDEEYYNSIYEIINTGYNLVSE